MTTVILLLVLAGLVATLRLLLVSTIRHDGYGRPSTGGLPRSHRADPFESHSLQ